MQVADLDSNLREFRRVTALLIIHISGEAHVKTSLPIRPRFPNASPTLFLN